MRIIVSPMKYWILNQIFLLCPFKSLCLVNNPNPLVSCMLLEVFCLLVLNEGNLQYHHIIIFCGIWLFLPSSNWFQILRKTTLKLLFYSKYRGYLDNEEVAGRPGKFLPPHMLFEDSCCLVRSHVGLDKGQRKKRAGNPNKVTHKQGKRRSINT